MRGLRVEGGSAYWRNRSFGTAGAGGTGGVKGKGEGQKNRLGPASLLNLNFVPPDGRFLTVSPSSWGPLPGTVSA